MNKQFKALVKTWAAEKCVGIEHVFVLLVDAYEHHREVGPAPKEESKPIKKEATKGKGALKKEPTKGKGAMTKESTKGKGDMRKPTKGAPKKSTTSKTK